MDQKRTQQKVQANFLSTIINSEGLSNFPYVHSGCLLNSETRNDRVAENFIKRSFLQDFNILENPVFILMKNGAKIKQKNRVEVKRHSSMPSISLNVQEPISHQKYSSGLAKLSE